MKQSTLKKNCYDDSSEGEVLVNYHGAKLEIIGIAHVGDKMILDVLPFTNQLRDLKSGFPWGDIGV